MDDPQYVGYQSMSRAGCHRTIIIAFSKNGGVGGVDFGVWRSHGDT